MMIIILSSWMHHPGSKKCMFHPNPRHTALWSECYSVWSDLCHNYAGVDARTQSWDKFHLVGPLTLNNNASLFGLFLSSGMWVCLPFVTVSLLLVTCTIRSVPSNTPAPHFPLQASSIKPAISKLFIARSPPELHVLSCLLPCVPTELSCNLVLLDF